MGATCSRNDEKKFENQCKEAETKVVLPTLDIRKIVEEIDQVECEMKVFDMKGIINVYAKHGVPEADFNKKDGVFQTYFTVLESAINVRQGFIAAMLPVCKGSFADKKDILWHEVLENDENQISYEQLIGMIHLVVILSAKTVPEIVRDDKTKQGNEIDPDILKLINCDDEILVKYAIKYYPDKPKEGDIMHKHEYTTWMMKIDGAGLFSSEYHRKALLEFIDEQKKQN